MPVKNYCAMSLVVIVHGQQSQDGRQLSTGGFCGSKALNRHISWLHYHIPEKEWLTQWKYTRHPQPKNFQIAPESRQMVTIFLD